LRISWLDCFLVTQNICFCLFNYVRPKRWKLVEKKMAILLYRRLRRASLECDGGGEVVIVMSLTLVAGNCTNLDQSSNHSICDTLCVRGGFFLRLVAELGRRLCIHSVLVIH
jgi:hypothetical protein